MDARGGVSVPRGTISVMTGHDGVARRYDRAGEAVGPAVAADLPGALSGLLAAVVGLIVALSPELILLPGGAYVTVPAVRSPLAVAALAAVLVGVLAARRHPALATVVVVLPFATTAWTGWFVLGWWLGLVAVATVAAHRAPPHAVAPAAAAVAATAWFTQSDIVASVPLGSSAVGDGPDAAVSLGGMLGLLVVAVSTAGAVGVWSRRRADAPEAAAERAMVARALAAAAAHRVSLVAARAEMAPPYRYADGDAARRVALAALAVDARRALGDLRHALVVLRHAHGDAPAGAAHARGVASAGTVHDDSTRPVGGPTRS